MEKKTKGMGSWLVWKNAEKQTNKKNHPKMITKETEYACRKTNCIKSSYLTWNKEISHYTWLTTNSYQVLDSLLGKFANFLFFEKYLFSFGDDHKEKSQMTFTFQLEQVLPTRKWIPKIEFAPQWPISY